MAKRTFDILASVIGLTITGPILLFLTMSVKLSSKGPVFYRGLRVGRGGKPFRIFKFRSMVVDAEKCGGSSTSDQDPRITPIGGLMRKYKLDELPQLINTLRGEMSIVGPRPEVQQYVDLYTEDEKPILAIRPGITDWASIWNSDEGAILAGHKDPDKAYEELIRPTKLRLQLFYAHHHSVWIDLRIIYHTLIKLLNKEHTPREIRKLIDSEQKDTALQERFDTVTELPGHAATDEQLSMMHTRYQLASKLAAGKEVLELACGPGIGFGYLLNTSRRIVGGDYDESLVDLAKEHYGSRVEVCKLDAQNLPYDNKSFDVILLLEAIYYLPDVNQFVSEARRVLRDNAVIMICTANCERPDFNPSPYSYKYYSARELHSLLAGAGFDVEVYGGYPVSPPGLHSQFLGTIRKFAIRHNLIPKTMAWKIRLKRLLHGKLKPIPRELNIEQEKPDKVLSINGSSEPVEDYKIIYAIGRRAA